METGSFDLKLLSIPYFDILEFFVDVFTNYIGHGYMVDFNYQLLNMDFDYRLIDIDFNYQLVDFGFLMNNIEKILRNEMYLNLFFV